MQKHIKIYEILQLPLHTCIFHIIFVNWREYSNDFEKKHHFSKSPNAVDSFEYFPIEYDIIIKKTTEMQ